MSVNPLVPFESVSGAQHHGLSPTLPQGRLSLLLLVHNSLCHHSGLTPAYRALRLCERDYTCERETRPAGRL